MTSESDVGSTRGSTNLSTVSLTEGTMTDARSGDNGDQRQTFTSNVRWFGRQVSYYVELFRASAANLFNRSWRKTDPQDRAGSSVPRSLREKDAGVQVSSRSVRQSTASEKPSGIVGRMETFLAGYRKNPGSLLDTELVKAELEEAGLNDFAKALTSSDEESDDKTRAMKESMAGFESKWAAAFVENRTSPEVLAKMEGLEQQDTGEGLDEEKLKTAAAKLAIKPLIKRLALYGALAKAIDKKVGFSDEEVEESENILQKLSGKAKKVIQTRRQEIDKYRSGETERNKIFWSAIVNMELKTEHDIVKAVVRHTPKHLKLKPQNLLLLAMSGS